MSKAASNTFRIDANYAAVQGSYWSSFCALCGFTAVYLSYKGLTNTQIGFTSSILSILSIFIQIVVSSYSDANARIPLKRIISVLYIIGITGCAVMLWLPIPIALLIVVYSIATASQFSINGLLNALMMQFSNMGLPVNYGWPRGIGSICFALPAYILGIVIERYSPDILLPIYVVLAVIAIVSVSLMPDPNRMKRQDLLQSTETKVTERSTSYWEMLHSNPTLILFFCVCVIAAVGQSAGMVFLIRIIEALGGSTRELGISMLIQSGVELPMMFASGWILKKFKTRDILVFSFFCFFIKSFATSIAPSIGIIYGIMAFSIFCFGLYGFASVIFANNIVKASEKVRAQSLVVLCAGIGGIIGSALSGYIIDSWGLKPLLTISWIVCLAAALLMLVCRQMHARKWPAVD